MQAWQNLNFKTGTRTMAVATMLLCKLRLLLLRLSAWSHKGEFHTSFDAFAQNTSITPIKKKNKQNIQLDSVCHIIGAHCINGVKNINSLEWMQLLSSSQDRKTTQNCWLSTEELFFFLYRTFNTTLFECEVCLGVHLCNQLFKMIHCQSWNENKLT